MSHARNHSFRPRLCRLEDRTAPAAGMLDPTFGVGGRMTTRDPIRATGIGSSTAIDSLGRIVVAGYRNLDGTQLDFAVARYTPAGVLDLSFGGTGVVMFGISSYEDIANSVTIDSLDRVVVAGYSNNGSNNDFAVARLTVAGTLDTSFDGDGKQIIAFGTSTDIAHGVTVDSLDRVVVAGSTFDSINDHVAVVRLTATGALDNSFDGDGKQTFAFGASTDEGYGVAVDSLDRVVVAGSNYNGSSYDFAVARLTTAGALDGAFDGDGKQTISFGPGNDGAQSVAIDSLGRIVLAGGTTNGSTVDFAAVRLTAAGALDSSFDGDGKQTVSFAASSNEYSFGVDVDSLDRIVAVGNTNIGSTDDFAVARLTGAGALDNSFDGDGKQTIAFGPDSDLASGVDLDALDRVVVAGYTFNGSNGDFALARLTVAGAFDGSFDGDGKQTLGLTQSEARGNAVAVDSLGRTVVAGAANNGSNYDFAVTRYTRAGALDTTFGGTGIVTFAFGMSDDVAFGIAVDSLDRVVVAGQTLTGFDSDFAVARLTAAGALDATFDGDGKLTIDFGAFDEKATGVVLDSLGRVVLAGYTDDQSNSEFALVRLTATGALDATFDSDGKQTITFGSTSDAAFAVAVDSLDRVVVAGSTHNGNDYDFAVARLTTAGALDNSFNGDGRRTIAFGDSTDEAVAVAVDSLDRVVIAGYTYDTSNFNFTFDFAVARLNVTGALDTSFDGDGRQTIAFGSTEDIGFGVAVDSHNRVVVAGYTGDGTNNDFAVARLTAAGALDTSFDADGRQTIDFGGTDFATGVAIASADRVVLGGFSIYNDEVFAVARLTGDTTTATGQVNDGSVQRSRVTSLTVRFSGQVTFSGTAEQAFTLMRTGGGAINFTANVSVEYGGTVVVLTNFTGTEAEFGSLRDGRYTLTALASQISSGGQALDGDDDGTPGGNFDFGDSQGLFRMYGDVNGDQTVNGFDLGFFRNAFGTQTGDPNYLSYLDLNGDGVINGFDLGQFRTRFGTMLP